MITIFNIGIGAGVAISIASSLAKVIAIFIIARHPELSNKKVQYLTSMFS